MNSTKIFVKKRHGGDRLSEKLGRAVMFLVWITVLAIFGFSWHHASSLICFGVVGGQVVGLRSPERSSIVRLDVKVGDAVTIGQCLAWLDDGAIREELAQLDEQELALRRRQRASLAELTALEGRELGDRRIDALHQRDWRTQMLLDTEAARADLAQQEIEWAASQAEHEEVEAALAQAERDLENNLIRGQDLVDLRRRRAVLQATVTAAAEARREGRRHLDALAAQHTVRTTETEDQALPNEIVALRRQAYEALADIELLEIEQRRAVLRNRQVLLVISSPVDGTVTKILAHPGAVVETGGTILRICSGGSHEVRVFAQPAQLVNVKVGDQVEVLPLDGRLGGQYATVIDKGAELLRIDPVLEPYLAPQLYGVTLTLKHPTGDLVPGEPVKVKMGHR